MVTQRAVIATRASPAPERTFVRCDPSAVRTVRNDGDEPARVLIVSAPTSSGYEPIGWA